MKRGYQHRYSTTGRSLYDVEARERKARTMVAVLTEQLDMPLGALDLLNVGGSTGIMDNYLAGFFRRVTGIDIDDAAIGHAKRTYTRNNLEFRVGDALDLPFAEKVFDVVVCSQVYEHVSDARR
ncbi:MAG: class I SAM-dependent methyltransferase, partial [Candidatus Latescibacterota bacterium]